MKESISLLTDEQAQHALLRLFELLPEEIWQGSKPTYGDIEFWREEIEAAATPEIIPFLAAVQDETNSAARGETARALLTEIVQYKPLRPYVEQAAEEATAPHMAPLPVIIIAATVVLAAIPKEIEWTDSAGNTVRIKLGQLDSAAEWVKSITGFLKEAILPFS